MSSSSVKAGKEGSPTQGFRVKSQFATIIGLLLRNIPWRASGGIGIRAALRTLFPKGLWVQIPPRPLASVLKYKKEASGFPMPLCARTSLSLRRARRGRKARRSLLFVREDVCFRNACHAKKRHHARRHAGESYLPIVPYPFGIRADEFA